MEKQWMKLSKKRTFSIMVVICLLASMLAACSGSNKDGEGKEEGEKEQQKKEISIMMPFYSKEPPTSEAAIKRIEEHTNSKLRITWVPASGYPEKLNATIASGSYPKILVVLDMKAPIIVNSAQSGMFWELGSYLSNYDHLTKLNPVALTNSAIEGKNYGIPRERVVGRNGLIIRKDWLDQLQLQEPETVEQLYDVIKQFATADPDNNGQADTLGLTESMELSVFNYVLAALGGGNEWQLVDEQLVPVFETEAYWEAMQFVKRLVDEKLLNRDFAIYPNRDDDINKEKTGIIFNPLDSAISGSFAELRNNNPDATFTVLGGLNSGDNGKKIIGGSGFNGTFMIPKTSVKTEEELQEVLSFINALMDEEMIELFTWGIEGQHFEKQDDHMQFTDKEAYTLEVDPLTQLVYMNYNYLYTTQSQSELGKRIEEVWQENETSAIHNPAQPFISATQVEKGKELDQLISDARVKYILGEIDQAGWESAIEQWKNNGGLEIIEQLTTSVVTNK